MRSFIRTFYKLSRSQTAHNCSYLVIQIWNQLGPLPSQWPHRVKPLQVRKMLQFLLNKSYWFLTSFNSLMHCVYKFLTTIYTTLFDISGWIPHTRFRHAIEIFEILRLCSTLSAATKTHFYTLQAYTERALKIGCILLWLTYPRALMSIYNACNCSGRLHAGHMWLTKSLTGKSCAHKLYYNTPLPSFVACLVHEHKYCMKNQPFIHLSFLNQLI